MNAVGIDVSKGKSMVAVMRPGGEVVLKPFEVSHTKSGLQKLAGRLLSLDGETKVVMEGTGHYHLPVAAALCGAGLRVSVVNALLVHGYDNDTIRKAKTDKLDAVKIAKYGLDRWEKLRPYVPEQGARLALKACLCRYQQAIKACTMFKNNLISLLDNTFPDANRLFGSGVRSDGGEKWVDFVAEFPHCQCVSGLTLRAFAGKYRRWCKRCGYNFSEAKATEIHAHASDCFAVLPFGETTRLLVSQMCGQIRMALEAMAALKCEMNALAAQLPEYPAVMAMFGVGESLGPQLIAEIGDVRRFHAKKALVAFAGVDVPPRQSGRMDCRERHISKRGSPSLRRALFIVMSVLLQNEPEGEPVYHFLDRKRREGKPYRVYMVAGATKFLRIYYATVKAHLNSLDVA